jgi:hypothetical protein
MLWLWEGILGATGGALREDKCFWYLLYFHYHAGQWRYATENGDDEQLHLLDGTQLTRLEPSEAKKH